MKEKATQAILRQCEWVEIAIGNLAITNAPLPSASHLTPYDLLNRYLIGAGAQIALAEELGFFTQAYAQEMHKQIEERFTAKWNRIVN